MNPELQFTSQLAQQAGELLLDFYRANRTQTNLKLDNSIVTEADLASDNFFQSAIKENFPEDGILSEEGNTVYPAHKSYVWVIDPLDGTTNFSLRLCYWGVSITRLSNGFPDLTVQYFPLLDEIFTATQGGGAFLNGSQLKINPSIHTQRSTFFSICSRTYKEYKVLSKYKTRILGSAAYGLSTVARGNAVFAFEVTPKIWDIAGSWLITNEAGGIISPLDGNNPFPLQQNVDYAGLDFPILAAPTEDRWEIGRNQLIKRENQKKQT